VSKKEGLPGNEVMDTLTDPDGRLWLATERGVGLLATPP
jgi:ligand-binding sensor domain-containing protein